MDDQPSGQWRVGDVVNGHRLDADGIWRRQYEVGEVVNGHRFGSDGAWHRVWQVGDVANGQRLGPDGVWRPLHAQPPLGASRPVPNARPKKWFERPLGIIGIVAASLLLLGTCGAIVGAVDDSSDNTEETTAQEESNAPDDPEVEDAEATDSPSDPAASSDAAEPSPTAEPNPKRRVYLVTRVIDGDTVQLGNGQDVRIVGIDTPETGDCGYQVATDNMVRLVQGKAVHLTTSDEDKDRYGRLLRYVDVRGVDAGLNQINKGFAIARYDSRDGYGFHPREPVYVKADKGTKQFSCPKPAPPAAPAEPANCMAGYSPCLPIVADLDCGEIGHSVTVTGSDPYRLDADGDGIGCDS